MLYATWTHRVIIQFMASLSIWTFIKSLKKHFRRPGDDRSSTTQGTSTAGVNRSPAQNVQDQEESHDSSAQGSQNQMERLICELTRFCQQMKIGFTNFEEELEKMKEKK